MFKQGGGEESSFFVSVGGEGVFCPCRGLPGDEKQSLAGSPDRIEDRGGSFFFDGQVRSIEFLNSECRSFASFTPLG